MYRPAIACLLSLSLGCATLVNGTATDVSVTSSPTGQKFVISPTGKTGRTPTVVRLKNGRSYQVAYQNSCGDTAQAFISDEISPWVPGNFFIFFGWSIWMGVDFVSGGARPLDENAHGTFFKSCEE